MPSFLKLAIKDYEKIFFLLALIPAFACSQIISIPDANLKDQLLNYSPPIDSNGDSEIQASEALMPTTLFLTNAGIADLTGIQAFTNLTFLNVAGNSLTTADLTGLTSLSGFNADYNQLASISLGNIDNLATFSVNFNNLASLDVSGKTIDYLSCTNSGLTQLLLANTQIQQLHCENNALTELDLAFMSALQRLFCFSNQITDLNFLNAPMLTRAECQDNPIVELDFRMNKMLFEVSLYNPELKYINFKNGGDTTIFLNSLGVLNDRLSVCTDPEDVIYWRDYFISTGTFAFVSPICSFKPGGSYNTISGSITYDLENDGCGAGDPVLPYRRIDVANGTSAGAVFTSADGSYNIYAGAGTTTATPAVEPNLFTATPAVASVEFPNIENNLSAQDFCLHRAGVFKDVEVTIAPGIAARPGFNATYFIYFHNKGTEVMNGTVNLTYLANLMDFVSADPAIESQAGGILEWAYSGLLPFETRMIEVTLHTHTPLDAPPVMLGTELGFVAKVFPMADDILPSDDTFAIKQIVVGSYDPNDITCLEGDSVLPEMAGEYLHYVTRFQNSGTFYAENVFVTTAIDPLKFDIATFEPIGTSHPGIIRANGGNIEFIFEGINLPAEQDDEPGSHGFVSYKIKSLPGLGIGDSVSQFADIYFDFNPPVVTNTSTTTFTLLNTVGFSLDGLKVYPNPASDRLTIETRQLIRKLSLFDLGGRLLDTVAPFSNLATLDIGRHADGIYLLRIEGNDVSETIRIVKN